MMTVRTKVSGLFATLACLAAWLTMAGAPPVAHAATLVIDRSCNSDQAAKLTDAFHEAAALAHGALGAYFSRPTSNAAMNWFNVTDFDSVHRVINTLQSTDNRFMGSGTITVKCTCRSYSDGAYTGANGF